MHHIAYQLPDHVRRTMLCIFGARGEAWTARFPAILAECAARWGLTPGVPYDDLSINYVTTVIRQGEPLVLKVGVPHREMDTEIEALRLYDGRGCVRCLEADAALGALLLEQVTPGTKLRDIGDHARETHIAASLMRTLPIPVPAVHGLPTFAAWLSRAFTRYRATFDAHTGPLGRLHAAAEAAFAEIAATSRGDVLLHGDLHHANILHDARRGWIAIDPKGVIGDRCLEVGRFLHNNLPSDLPLSEIEYLLRERLAILAAELPDDPARLARAMLVDRVLSLTWCLEDTQVLDGWDREVALAEMMRAMVCEG